MASASQVYAMLGNQTLWKTAEACHLVLGQAGIPHAILGGVAVCLHGYQRNTVDLDLLVRPSDRDHVRDVMTAAGYQWSTENCEFRSPEGMVVQFLTAGDRAGADSLIKLPDPADERAATMIEGLPVVSLARLIEIKLACGLGSIRRTHKDFADVVELISIRGLSRSFARHLDKSVRQTFRELVLRTRDEP